jgi:glycosyltransferase involved in cell wall biosynthesis
MGKNPKILFIVSTFCRYEGEMQNPWMIETIRNLRKLGYEIHVLAPSFKGLKSHTIEGIPVHRFRYFFKSRESLTHDQGGSNKIRGSLLYKLMFFPYIICGIVSAFRYARKNPFDIIHVHWPFPHGLMGIAARLGSRLPRPKLVLSFYGASLLLADKFKFVDPVLRYIIRKSDGVVSISNFVATRVNMVHKIRQSIIPFGTPLGYDPQPLPNNETREILTVTRIIERKGVEFLVRAMPEILKHHKARLYIVGSGDQGILQKLKDLRSELNLQDNVAFLGRISDADIRERYKECDIFCLPAIIDSRGDTEGLGVVLLEAMNYGRPVVGSNVGGIPDIIRHEESGLLCRQRDPEDIARQILRVFNEPEFASKLARQGADYAKTEFGWDKITNSWEDFYSSVLKG